MLSLNIVPSMVAYRIRRAARSDVPVLAALYSAFVEDLASFDPMAVPNPRFSAQASMAAAIDAVGHVFLVAESHDAEDGEAPQGDVIGFIRVQGMGPRGEESKVWGTAVPPRWTVWRVLAGTVRRLIVTLMYAVAVIERRERGLGGPSFVVPRSAYITDCYVTPEHRRSGVGRLLVESAVQWAQDGGLSVMELSVAARNDVGSTFWAEMGFRDGTRVLRRDLTTTSVQVSPSDTAEHVY